eukprot:gnl/TRDRNA2_/TRDRNA2_175640_c0_seq2.p1 gnl/TRDRNA2_/TRDRNA2_175640_c0~~gnl/TRDRNA2_/TRDRNA2_175640_c0_seq2.p1  ORF type:complete len:373 (+),score=48.20 gnl/TRDRNA2_/TRDRNA2_175640_c0_seq2:73-1191(+)
MAVSRQHMRTLALIASGFLVYTVGTDVACSRPNKLDGETCSEHDSIHFMQLPAGLSTKTIHDSHEQCKLHMITIHQGFSNQSINEINASAPPTTWPHHIKAALMNLYYEQSQNTEQVKYTPFLAPGDGKDGVLTHEGRGFTWWKLKLITKLLADYVAKPEGSRGGCQWLLWIDADAFVAEPDADVMRVLANLPAKRIRFNANGMQPDDGIVDEATIKDFALVAAREYGIEEFLPRVVNHGQLNGGILLLNFQHPKLKNLIDAWWESPISGVCERTLMTQGLQDQPCFNNLIRFNETTRAIYSELVGEVDFVSLNSPLGRMIRHTWEEKKSPPVDQTLTNTQMAADGLLETGGRSYELLQLLRSHTMPFPAYS